MTYAKATKVSVQQSRVDVERLVAAKGAGQFMSAFDNDQAKAMIGWTMGGRMVRLVIPLPDRGAEEFKHPRNRSGGYVTWRRYVAEEQQRRWEQACRSRWRAILLIIKAKFEAIEAGITTFEREFLADTVMANGATLGEWVAPQLEAMYQSGDMPRLLPGLGETSR